MRNSFKEKNTGLLVASDFKTVKYKTIYWLFFAILLIISIVCILPILWVFISAFKDTSEFLSIPPTIIPKSFHPEKVGQVFSKLKFGIYYLNSFKLIIGSLFFCIVVNGLAGYVLSRLKPKGSGVIFTMIFWTMLLPTSLNMIPLFMSFVDVPLFHINLTNSFLPLWLMAGANAFDVLLFRNFFNAIPHAYIEAAKIDGCSNFGIFWRIIVPLSRPILMVVSIFSVQASWGSFFWPYLVLKDTDKYPVSVILYQFNEASLPIDQYMIVMMLSILPVLILFSIFSKYIIDTSNMSGLKG